MNNLPKLLILSYLRVIIVKWGKNYGPKGKKRLTVNS